MSTPLAVFGPGILIVTRTDITPGAAINVGYVQELSLDASASIKELYGQFQSPLVAARGTIKYTGKFKAATISGLAWNTAFYAGSFTSTGTGISWNIDSTFTTSTTSTTLAVGSTATFDADLGVRYATSNLPLQRVSTGNEATGKYSLNAAAALNGTYNFAAGDQGVAIKVTYTALTGAGQTLIQTNQLLGTTPTFQLDYYTNLNQPTSKPFVVRMFEAVGSKHTMSFKLEDFMTPELDFSLFANASGQIYSLVFPEVS